MNIKGKKAFCFLALKHHSRFLLPISRALERRGMEIQYLTAPAELPFELTLQAEGLPYKHTQDYSGGDVRCGIDRAYRKVRAEWKERFLRSEVLHHFTLPVQDKILRMHVDNFYLFRRMFEVEKPDLVLALHELNSWGKMLGYLSHEFRVPLVTLQEGLYYAPAAVYRFHTEYSSACLVWGEATREVLVNSGGSADKIFITGNTHLPTVVAKESARAAVKRTRGDLNVGKGKKIVTLLMGGLGYDKGFAFPPALLDWLRACPELVLMCKWHPVTNKLLIEEIARPLARLDNIRMLQDFDTYRLLAASDVCIVFGNSTTGLEALAFGKPLIEVQLCGLDYSFARQGVADAVSTLAELPAKVESALAGAAPAGRAARVKEYLGRNLYRLDVQSVERCVGAIERMVGAREAGDERRVVSLYPGKVDPLCSVILPLRGTEGAVETLLGMAQNTGERLSYECVISTSLKPAERGELIASLSGDVTVIDADGATLGALCNLGAERAAGKYLCFLAPGWVPQRGWLEGLVHQLKRHPEIGIAGGLALFSDGSLAHAGIAIDANLSPVFLYRRLPATFAGSHRERTVRAVVGCLLVRREAYLDAGGFDAAYQSRWGELDFCFAAGRAAWKVVFTPESLFICLAEPAPARDDSEDRLRFFAKWVGDLWPDQNAHWQADQIDAAQLAALYQEMIGPSAGCGESLTG